MSSATTTELRRNVWGSAVDVVLDVDTIATRVGELGGEITAAFPEGDLLVLGLLKGSFVFLADLIRSIDRPLHLDFITVSSYGNERNSSGTVSLLHDPATPLQGRHVVVVDDIVETGHTLAKLVHLLSGRQPRSLSICALLDKNLMTTPLSELRWVGFQAPTDFLVGYGLDHAEDYRHLPYIGKLTDA